MGRTIAAVVIGYAVWTALWLGGGAGIQATWADAVPEEGPITATAPLTLLLALSVLCSFVAGAVAARVGNSRRGPVLVMAVLLLVTGIGVQVSIWDRMPPWFHLPFLLLIVPVCMLGGRRRRTD